jgi:hypothetical protein
MQPSAPATARLACNSYNKVPGPGTSTYNSLHLCLISLRASCPQVQVGVVLWGGITVTGGAIVICGCLP